MEGTDRGAGLRVIFENRSVYGYTTELTEQSLVQLAETLSEAVTAKDSKPWNKSIEWIKTRQPSDIAQYKIGRDPRNATLAEKIKIAERADHAARSELPNARQVTSVVLDTLRKILVLNTDGAVSSDAKPISRCSFKSSAKNPAALKARWKATEVSSSRILRSSHARVHR